LSEEESEEPERPSESLENLLRRNLNSPKRKVKDLEELLKETRDELELSEESSEE
jgi:hypothetical protein